MNAPLPPIITSLYLSQLEILKTLRKDKKNGPFERAVFAASNIHFKIAH